MEKNIFIGMSGGFGPLAQVLPITNILKQKGYKILANIHRNAREMLQMEGYELVEFPDRELPKNAIPPCREWWNLGYFFCKYGYGDYTYVKTLVNDYLDLFVQREIGLVIAALDPICVIAAKILKLPIISITQSCFSSNSIYNQLNWWDKRPDNLPNAVYTINTILDEYGLDSIDRMEDLSNGDLTIIPSFPEFDPLINTENVIYTGLMCWQGVCDYSKINIVDDKKNKIFVYTGHFYDSGGRSGILILENVIKAFENKDVSVYVTTGLGQEVPDDMIIPNNIKIYEWLPVNDILNEFDLVIHHGGHGISLQSIASGVPSVVIPTFDEREYNARQLELLNVGKMIKPDTISPSLLYQESINLIRNKGIKENIFRLKNKVDMYGLMGSDGVVSEIIKLIEES